MRAVFAVLALTLAACSTTPPPPVTSAPTHLSGTNWTRTDDTDANPHAPTMQFGDARVSGYDGCNQYFTSVTQEGERIHFGPIASTRMACEAEPTAAAERRFLAVLAAARFAHYDQDTLVLLDEQQHQLATFSNDH